MMILLVDEDKANLDIIREYVFSTCPNSEIFSLSDPCEALSFVETNKVDIIFTEIMMKKLSGILLARKVKEIDRDTYVVFVTNVKDYAMDAWRIGVNDYILKPVTEERISYILKEKLEKLIS